jgi:hypothetical protein
LIAAARDEAVRRLQGAAVANFGSVGVDDCEFPTGSDAFDGITLHRQVLRAVAQLLGTEDVLLSQSDVWAKRGASADEWARREPWQNHEQRIHVDFPNHCLTAPAQWSQPEAVAMIVYLDDSAATGGGTALVPRLGDDDEAYREEAGRFYWTQTPGVGSAGWLNDRAAAEAWYAQHEPETAAFRRRLYAREVSARFGVGSVLLYRHDVWHRGTRVQPGAVRHAINLVFRRADARHINNWNSGWARKMWTQRDSNSQPADPRARARRRLPSPRGSRIGNRPSAPRCRYLLRWPRRAMEELLAALDPEQRAALGFPRPGSSYWTPRSLDAVEARFGRFGLDLGPYRRAAAAASRARL